MITYDIEFPLRRQHTLYPIGDVHIGALACDKPALKSAIKKIKSDKTARVILMGDILDAIMAGDKRFNVFEADPDLRSFQEQVDYVRDLFKPIGSKIIGVLEGNHEAKIKKLIGYNFTKFLAEDLDTLYLHQSCLLKLNCRFRELNVLAMHGIGGGATLGGQLRKIRTMMEHFDESPDMALVGHYHRLDNVLVPKMDHKLGVHEKFVGFTGTFYRTYVDGYPNYASEKWYSPSLIGHLRYHITPKKIEGFIDTY